jgi:signal transduction histidine kinase
VLSLLDRRVRAFRSEDIRLLASFAERLARAFDDEEYAREREAFVRRLTEQNAELVAAKERLLETDRLKSQFVGMMSHELRTPLNIFIGYTEILLDGAREGAALTPERHREVLARMLDAAHTLSRLVEDTLSVLRLESAGVPVKLETIAIEALFDELRSAERFLPSNGAVEERWEVERGLPALMSDRLKLRQIVTNLVGNARKFTRAGTVTVQAARAPDGALALTVRDTGCGIAAEELPFIFDLYRQAASRETHNGCGIGLYIVRRYCELLGGSVEVESESGRGSTFRVRLPFRAVAPGALGMRDRSAA